MSEVLEVCGSAYNLTYHPIYRTSLFVHLIVSALSMIPLGYFVIFKLFKTGFHGNLKFLLGSYFISIFLFSVDFAVISSIEIIIPYFSEHPCDLLIRNYYLKIGNFTISFFMTLSTFFPISITIERFIAMKSAENYEKTKIIIGPALTICNIFLDSSLLFKIYKPENFDDGSISFVFFPKTLAPKMFIFLWGMVIFNLINFVFNSFLLRQNNRTHSSTSSLSTKYQREEIYQSTKFAAFVIFCHFTFFGLYVIGIIILRYLGNVFITDPMNLMAVRGAFTTMISSYNLVIGIVAIYLNRKFRVKKTEELSETIRMEATGSAGAQNYDNAILDIWNSVSRRQ